MEILKKIATPFIAIWRWIKDTAWVQPLLIVGVIFGLIFSIPGITKGIQKAIETNKDGLDYYKTVQLSLQGAKDGTSATDLFFESYEKAQSYVDGKQEHKVDYDNFKSKYGEKFFLVFAQSDCDYCEKISDALEELNSGWNDKYNLPSEETYKCWSIVCNQDMKSNEKYYKDKKPFEYILNDHSTFFEQMQAFGTRNTYFNNLGSEQKTSLKGYVNNFLKGVNDVHVPCVVLFDLTNTATNNGSNWTYLVNTVFFEIPNSYDTNEVTRAQFLSYAWSHKNDFEIKK